MKAPVVDIDPNSGFCFGVTRAIRLAEDELARGPLASLGDIVHNEQEVSRLEKLGLETVHSLPERPMRILLRAHGEPPSTYTEAEAQGHELIDATCPVVLRLQAQVKAAGLDLLPRKGLIIIYGKPDHAEVNGLRGQTPCECCVVQSIGEIEELELNRPVACFSQTTMDPSLYKAITQRIRERMKAHFGGDDLPLSVYDTSCSRVSNRKREVALFAHRHHVIVFVTGQKSSNGQMLLDECRKANAQTYPVGSPEEVQAEWFNGANSIGISGATSTPRWLMEAVAKRVKSLIGLTER